MPKEIQKIDFLKQNLQEYIKIARENNNDYSFRISNGLRAGNENTVFFLSDNFIIFKYLTHPTTSRLKAFAYGLSKKNKKAISECTPMSRSGTSQTIGVTITAYNTIVQRYKIISSEPEMTYHTKIELISYKFKHLMDLLELRRQDVCI